MAVGNPHPFPVYIRFIDFQIFSVYSIRDQNPFVSKLCDFAVTAQSITLLKQEYDFCH